VTGLGTVLVIDDDLGTIDAFARMLRLDGFEVRTANNAECGLEAADAVRPDAIIVDLRMPLMDGLGFLYQLRSRAEHRHTPVAIVTGDYLMDQVIEDELIKLGAQIHYKPLWLEDLLVLAHSLLKAERRLTATALTTLH